LKQIVGGCGESADIFWALQRCAAWRPKTSLAFLKRIFGRELFRFFAAAEGILGTVAILPGTAYSLADLPLDRSVV
jgi:hypothetical protein